MFMKKLLPICILSSMLVGCAGTENINASRGTNSSRVTQAELDQYNKQRANEVIEAQAQAAKAEAYSETIRQGASAVKSGVSAIQSVLDVFR